jgi:hypothetical protein
VHARFGRGQLAWAVALLGAASLVGVAVAGASPGLPLPAMPRMARVMVLLKGQAPAFSASAIARDEATRNRDRVSAELASAGARDLHAFQLINAFAATVPVGEVGRLTADPAVSEVVPDAVIRETAEPSAAGAAVASPSTPIPGACGAPGHVQLAPEALSLIHAQSQSDSRQTAETLGINGSGVTVGFVADGLDIDNPDFIRPDGRHVFVDYKNFTAQGTNVNTGGDEAFGDASAIAAQGRDIYDVSHQSALPLNRRCLIRIEGAAPGVKLVGLDVFGGNGTAFVSAELEAIDYAVMHDHVQVLNESLGDNMFPDDGASLDPLKRANAAAVAAGTTVVTSSGDAGATNTIDSPATGGSTISVGASTSYRLDVQSGFDGGHLPGIKGWINDNIAAFSSSGFGQRGGTVDLVAPGDGDWALCTPVPRYSSCTSLAGHPSRVERFSGTSQAAPFTTAVAALVIEAYRKTHQGATPTPDVVKRIILSTADDTGAPAEQQGSGSLDAYKAVLAAESYGTRSRSGDTLLVGHNQLRLAGPPGSSYTVRDVVTNTGGEREIVSLATRGLGSYTTIKTATVHLSDQTSAHVISSRGAMENLAAVHFTVPRRENRLNVAVAFASGPSTTSAVQLALLTPRGQLALTGAPEGPGNYSDAQVTNPAAGRWTAYVFSPEPRFGGFAGRMPFAAEVARDTSFGTVTPSQLSLAPGQSRAVTLRLSSQRTPGDSAGAVVLRTDRGPGFGRATTIPVTVRSFIPPGDQVFMQTLTGGNGRSPNVGSMFSYQLIVPTGRRELNVNVDLARDKNSPFSTWLVDPNGDAVAFSSNQLRNYAETGYSSVLGAQLHVLSPVGGTWTLLIQFAEPSGTAISEPFTVRTDYTPVQASVPGLPDSSATQLTAGTAYHYQVQVVNNGQSPERYFVDARTPASVEFLLADYGGGPVVSEPLPLSTLLPKYVVPTHTTGLFAIATTTGRQPLQFTGMPLAGDPEVASTIGRNAIASYVASPIDQGFWFFLPDEAGSFAAAAGPRESAALGVAVRTEGFDSSITSSTGDLWLSGANAANHYVPIVVAPGATGTIPLTITPHASAGTVVRGTLYVDDNSYARSTWDTGDDVAAIPYEYTVQ